VNARNAGINNRRDIVGESEDAFSVAPAYLAVVMLADLDDCAARDDTSFNDTTCPAR
jgi:hypothetical protein